MEYSPVRGNGILGPGSGGRYPRSRSRCQAHSLPTPADGLRQIEAFCCASACQTLTAGSRVPPHGHHRTKPSRESTTLNRRVHQNQARLPRWGLVRFDVELERG